MSNLKSLVLASTSRPRNDPVLNRREKLRVRLEEQKRLLEDDTYLRTIQRWTRVDGEKTLIMRQLPMRYQ